MNWKFVAEDLQEVQNAADSKVDGDSILGEPG